MNAETIKLVVMVLGLLALVYAWYTERTRRRVAEVERDVAQRRVVLDGLEKKLDENKIAFDKAKADLDGAIPPHMLEYLGMDKANANRPSLHRDPRHGRLVDANTGLILEEPGPALPDGVPESRRFFDLGASGETKAPG